MEKKFTENRKIKFWIGVDSMRGSNLVFKEIFDSKKSAEALLKKHGWKIIKVEINKI